MVNDDYSIRIRYLPVRITFTHLAHRGESAARNTYFLLRVSSVFESKSGEREEAFKTTMNIIKKSSGFYVVLLFLTMDVYLSSTKLCAFRITFECRIAPCVCVALFEVER